MSYIVWEIPDPELLIMYRRMASIDLGVPEFNIMDFDKNYLFLRLDLTSKSGSLHRARYIEPNDIITKSYKEFIDKCKIVLNENIT